MSAAEADCFRYFTDPDLLKRIPQLFYLLSGVFVVMQIMGFLCIREPDEKQKEELSHLLTKGFECLEAPDKRARMKQHFSSGNPLRKKTLLRDSV